MNSEKKKPILSFLKWVFTKETLLVKKKNPKQKTTCIGKYIKIINTNLIKCDFLKKLMNTNFQFSLLKIY